MYKVFALGLALFPIALVAQEPAVAPFAQPDTKAAPAQPAVSIELREEVAKANERAKSFGNPARSWVSEDRVVVYYDEKMWWTIQAKGLSASAGGTYSKHGAVALVVWNGKKAWRKELKEGADTVELKGPIPTPTVDIAGLESVLPLLNAYNSAASKG